MLIQETYIFKELEKFLFNNLIFMRNIFIINFLEQDLVKQNNLNLLKHSF